MKYFRHALEEGRRKKDRRKKDRRKKKWMGIVFDKPLRVYKPQLSTPCRRWG
ncbi:MAG: hypothetical protein F6K24_11260 [Okeania sp. SIO2D1]|nr:hypothetical protein [Okeania sp. SIO2D1]